MFRFRKIYSEIVRKKFGYGKKIVRYNSQDQTSGFYNDYQILYVTPPLYESVIKLFRFSYIMTEPLLMASDLSYKYNPLLENTILDNLTQSISLVAVCKRTGNIVGAAVNRGLCPWDPLMTTKFSEKLTCPKMERIFKLMSIAMSAGDPWNKYNEHKLFDIAFIMTERANERRGIANNLIKSSVDLAKDLTYNVVIISATNYYLQKSCRKAGMTLIAEVPYKSYLDCNGKQIFDPPGPHKGIQVFVSLPHAPSKDGASK